MNEGLKELTVSVYCMSMNIVICLCDYLSEVLNSLLHSIMLDEMIYTIDGII